VYYSLEEECPQIDVEFPVEELLSSQDLVIHLVGEEAEGDVARPRFHRHNLASENSQEH
jgi:hypothetical protein